MAEQGYIGSSRDGWLNVKRAAGGAIVALPQYLSVEILSEQDGRTQFRVAEGVEAGATFTAKSRHLARGNPGYRGAARIRFDKRKSLVTFPAGQARVVVNPFTPTPNGAHPIQIPDFPHPLAARYMGRSAYAMSWFHLGRGDAIRGSTGQDRYLHCGSASLGCITVEPADWTALYLYLMLCRSGDGRTVGTAIVD